MVTMNIIDSTLVSICREMGLTMMKTAYSTIFNEGMDFTCGLGNVQIPAGIAQVIVRASDNVHKAGKVTLNRQAAAEALARQPSSQAAGKKKGRPGV